MSDLDLEKLKAAREEFGYSPASTDDKHLAKLRADNECHDHMNAADPDGKKWAKMAPRSAPDPSTY